MLCIQNYDKGYDRDNSYVVYDMVERVFSIFCFVFVTQVAYVKV